MSPSSPPPSEVVQYSLTRRFQTTADGLVSSFSSSRLLNRFSYSSSRTSSTIHIKRRIPFSPENRKFREKWFDLVNHFWRKIFRIDTFCSEFCIFSYSGNVQIDSFRLFCIFVWWYPRLIRCARRIREVGGKFEFRSGWWVPDGAENCSKRNFFLFFFLHFIRFFLPNQPSKQMT